MTTSANDSRRSFLLQLAGTAAAAGLAACAPQGAASTNSTAPAPAPAPSGPPPKQTFDDSWTTRVQAAKHKAVFDSPEIDEGNALWQAWAVGRDYRTMFGENEEWVPVVVIRHAAIPMALSHALWEKYGLGKELKFKDPVTGAPALRNPFYESPADAKFAVMSPESSIKGIIEKGGIVLGCNQAARAFANRTARRLKLDPAATRAEVIAGMAPGVILQPTGIYATLRAQEFGCGFLQSS